MADIVVDDEQWRRFARAFPREAGRVAELWLRRASQLVIRGAKQQAKQRFGVETAESGMKSVDPRRPKGFWMASLRAVPEGRDVLVGPSVPYARFPEDGIAGTTFRGHKALKRGAEQELNEIQAEARRLVAEGLDRSVAEAGGRP